VAVAAARLACGPAATAGAAVTVDLPPGASQDVHFGWTHRFGD